MSEPTLEQVAKYLDEHVLLTMYWMTPGSGWEFYGFPFRAFVTEEFNRHIIRGICHSLTDRGLTSYRNDLFSEDGELVGSGYGLTKKGKEYVEQLLKEEEA